MKNLLLIGRGKEADSFLESSSCHVYYSLHNKESSALDKRYVNCCALFGVVMIIVSVLVQLILSVPFNLTEGQVLLFLFLCLVAELIVLTVIKNRFVKKIKQADSSNHYQLLEPESAEKTVLKNIPKIFRRIRFIMFILFVLILFFLFLFIEFDSILSLIAVNILGYGILFFISYGYRRFAKLKKLVKVKVKGKKNVATK